MAKSTARKPVTKTASRPNQKSASSNPDAGSRSPKFDPGSANNTDTDASLEELFTSELKEMYWSENHLVKALPKMVDAAGSAALRKSLEEHRKITMKQASRLEQVFDMLGEKILAKKCAALEGIVMWGEQVIESTLAGSAARDTGIIMASLKVEHYEITAYTGLIALANKLGKTDAAGVLSQNLTEEQKSADMLTGMMQEKK